jgi:spore maturation protein CgeB
LFEVAGVPLAIFWTNAPRRSLMPMDSAPPMGLSRSRVTHFVPDSEEAAALERLGLRARYLPLGTFFHEARPPAALLRRFRAEVAFVGHAAVREDGADLIGARFGAWVRRAVDAAARSVLAGWPPMRALAEAIAALPEADRRAARAAARRAAEAGLLLRQVVATASVRRRCSIVGSLGRPALVYGDPSDWPLAHPRVLRRPPVNYHVELPALYRATAVNLNVTNPQFPRAVNQRVFDVPAAGGFLLTDRRGDLARHFIPGREVVVYDGLPDLREKVRWHLAHPAERRRIAGRARARCRAEHSWLDRARTIATAMTEL